jgi:PAS domain S-box-containing protein
MPKAMIRRVDISLSAGFLFVTVVAAAAVWTTKPLVERSIMGVLLFFAAAAVWLLRRAIVHDLLARAAADARLRDHEARFAGILAIAADAIVTTDEAGRIVHFNHGAETIFGYAASDVIGQPLEMLFPPARATAHRRHVLQFAHSCDTARSMSDNPSVSGRRRNGEEFPAEVSISKLPTSEGTLFTAMVRDVTEQRRREHFDHTLAIAGARLGTTLDYDSTLRLVAELPVHAAGDWCLLDVIEEGETGSPVLRRIASSHSDAGSHQALRSIEARGLDWDAPSDSIDVVRTGEARVEYQVSDDWLEAHAVDATELDDLQCIGIRSCATVPLLARERAIGTLVVGTSIRTMLPADVTLLTAIADRAALAIDNAALYRQTRRALAGRDHVLAVVSHDLRTPAAAIAMCARTLLDHPPEAPEARHALCETILESSDWMHRLIQDLLDAASIDAGRLAVDPQPQPLAPIVSAVTDLFRERAHSAGIALDVALPNELPLVLADHARVVQLLGNLVGNALRFTPAGGAVMLGGSAGLEGVTISVRDTGAGIAPEHLPHVFDRFWRAEKPGVGRGNGLGLAIAKGIVDAHHGRIWVESGVGRGSAFFVLLPAA